MKKILFAVFALILGILGGRHVQAQEDIIPNSEQVTSFQSDIQVQADRSVTITETITYQFGPGEHHGIYRNIPERYQRNGTNYRLHFVVDRVLMDGSPVAYSITSRSPVFSLKIGEKDRLVNGTHVYAISYHTDRAINFFEDHDEFYWNVTGNEWQIPINSASASVRGPEGFNAASSTSACYTGAAGSAATDCTISHTGSATTIFKTRKGLNPAEGLTIVVSFPKGLITPLSASAKIMQVIWDNLIFLLPFVVFGFMYAIWNKYGREPKGRGTIVPQYESPRGLTPLEMSALKYQTEQMKAITASIIDLARRGYLRIKYEEKKHLIGSTQTYTFEKRKDEDDTLKAHERYLLSGLFAKHANEVTLDQLKGDYYTSIKHAHNAAFTEIQRQGFFSKNPQAVRATWIGTGVFVLFGIFLIMDRLTFGGIVSVVLSAFIVIAFGWNMPQKTKEGAIVLEEIEGFKWFLSVTEKDRLAFANAPKLKPELFHAFLPYAIALGVDELWAKQFDGMMIPEPDYAVGFGNMNTFMFIQAMHGFNSNMSAAAMPPQSAAGRGASGFGGGGFSGGGFGGGGGGSW